MTTTYAPGQFSLYTDRQNPHVIRLLVGAFMLHIRENKLRVVALDVGGGFGSKSYHYAEEADISKMTVSTENAMCTQSPRGSKSGGEVGVIGSPPAVINAVVDAVNDERCAASGHARDRAQTLVYHPGCEAPTSGGIDR